MCCNQELGECCAVQEPHYDDNGTCPRNHSDQARIFKEAGMHWGRFNKREFCYVVDFKRDCVGTDGDCHETHLFVDAHVLESFLAAVASQNPVAGKDEGQVVVEWLSSEKLKLCQTGEDTCFTGLISIRDNTKLECGLLKKYEQIEKVSQAEAAENIMVVVKADEKEVSPVCIPVNRWNKAWEIAMRARSIKPSDSRAVRRLVKTAKSKWCSLTKCTTGIVDVLKSKVAACKYDAQAMNAIENISFLDSHSAPTP